MRKATFLAATITLVAMLVISATAFAQPRGEYNRPDRGFYFNKLLYELADELGLSEDQEDALDELQQDHAKEIIILGADAAVIAVDLKALFKVQGNDGQVRTTHTSLQAEQSELAEARITFQLDRRSIFTDNQWATITEAIEEAIEDRPERDPGEGRDFDERLAEIQVAVGLTDDQVADLTAIHEAAQADAQTIRDQLEPVFEELAELMKIQDNDGEVITTHAEIEDLKNEIDDLQLEARLDARNVYTADQWEAYLEWREDKRFEGNQGQRRGPGGNN